MIHLLKPYLYQPVAREKIYNLLKHSKETRFRVSYWLTIRKNSSNIEK